MHWLFTVFGLKRFNISILHQMYPRERPARVVSDLPRRTYIKLYPRERPARVVSCCCLFGFNVAFNNFFVISSGCDRELYAHFYSATSLNYHAPDTWHDTTPSHIILTLGRPVLALRRNSECQARRSKYHFLTTLVCRGPGSNPWPPVPRSGHSTNWATGPGS